MSEQHQNKHEREISRILYINCGLMGSGKSTVANALARELALKVFSSDPTRKRLAGLAIEQKGDAGIYSAAFTALTYQTLFGEAKEALKAGHDVLIDATFGQTIYRTRARQLAHASKARFIILVYTMLEAELRKRLIARATGEYLDNGANVRASDGTVESFDAQKANFSWPSLEEGDLVINLDPTQPVETMIRQIKNVLLELKS